MKLLKSLLIFSIGILACAQQKLEITYSSHAKIANTDDFLISTNGNVSQDDIKKSLLKSLQEPTFSTLTIFNNESLYKPIEKIDNQQKTGFQIKMNFGGTGTYYNLQDAYYLETSQLANKEVTIKDKPANDWKLTRETKKVLGYSVKKAVKKGENDRETIAWYTTDLNFKTGPEKYFGLPGLVLEVEVPFGKSKEDKRIITATDVKILEDTKSIEKPSEKNVMTAKAFEENSKKEFEKMKGMMSQGVDKKD